MPPELAGPYIPAAVAFVVSSFLTIGALWDVVDGIRSWSWPSVQGHAIDHGVSRGASQYAVDDAFVVAYEYVVDGVTYQGMRFDYAGRNTMRQSAKLLKHFGKGSQVRVFYDPRNPDRAVLRPGIGPWTILPFLLGVVGLVLSGPLTTEAVAIVLAR